MTDLTDESTMPWGVHRGSKMENVPASYLLWLYGNNKCDRTVKKYITENLDFIKLEIKQK